MKALLDADVLVDVALDRDPFIEQSGRVVEWCQQTPHSAVVAWHTISNLYYVLRAARSDTKARAFIVDVLHFAIVASGGNSAVEHALRLGMSDFEDALQVAAGYTVNVGAIVTRNLRDYRNAPVPVYAPDEFVALVRA